MLREADAWALLERNCAPMRNALWIGLEFNRCSEWEDAVREHVDMILQPMCRSHEATEEGRGLAGAHLRLALGVAQAVSCCRGFAPATQQGFWRRVVATLWTPFNSLAARPHRLAFTATAFTHVGLEWRLQSRVADAFWAGFLHGDPTHDAVLASVLDQLRPHFASSFTFPPPLRVSLSHCYSNDPAWTFETEIPSVLPYEAGIGPVVTPEVLRTILRAALDPPTTDTWTVATTQLGLVVEHHLDYATARETLDLLVRAQSFTSRHLELSIDRVVVHFAPPSPPHGAASTPSSRRALVTRGRRLGVLLRALLVGTSAARLRVHAVELSSCSHGDFRHVGAALSVAAPPVALLRCRGLFHVMQLRHKRQRLAWLAFTLLLCRRRCNVPSVWALSLACSRVAIDDRERNEIEQLVARGTPLRDVVSEALRLRFDGDESGGDQRVRVRCLRFGSVVRFARGTRLFFEPFRALKAEVATKTTDEDEPFELVAHVVADGGGGWVALVYAGYGLVWAAASTVAVWQPLGDVAANDGVVETESASDAAIPWLSSLTLRFEGSHDLPLQFERVAHRVTRLLPLLTCSTLKMLTIDRAVVTRDDLAQILDAFPLLETLVLDRCVVESVEPLIAALGQPRRPSLSSLSLLGVRDMRKRRRLAVDADVLFEEVIMGYPEDGDAPEWMASFVNDIAVSGNGFGLCELHIDVKAMSSHAAEYAALETLARALAPPSSLIRLHITSREDLQNACTELLHPWRDTLVKIAPRVRSAILSVLRAWDCVLPEIGRPLLKLTQDDAIRTITWDAVTNA